MTLSILIPSIESRRELLSELVCGLILQCGIIKNIFSFDQEGCNILILKFDKTEIIVAIDNKQITTGQKRNLLLSLANNEYCVQIDEDDYVYPYYVEEILNAIKSSPDCVATNGIMTTDGNSLIEWRLSKSYPNVTINENGKQLYLRTTNHISPVKRELALKAMFPHISNGEDKEFSDRLNQFLFTETRIDKPMYHYKFNSKKREY
ncbi:MAG: glycosyltransferase family A protein [Ferruginibacter sp.]